MLMIEHKDVGWWYWLASAGLLTYGVAGNPVGFVAAIGLTVFQLIHYVIREKSFVAFPVQVRFWYLVLVMTAFYEPLQWVYWIPAIGTWAQVIFGYCLLARSISLFPRNRSEPLSAALLQKAFFSRPVRGSVQQGFAERKQGVERYVGKDTERCNIPT